MAYMDCVVCAVPTANKEAYRKHAKEAFPMFKEQGAESMIECWGDDVPEGKVNSLHTAVDRKADETIVMSYIRWPSKTARDAAWEKIMSNPEMEKMDMPFDGSRMIFGGFELLVEAL
ncbi:RNA signal recognition particle [Erythrobacter sp. QSSC1-22B]|uniref:DUF1428 domain-containing protein n=1 Tax=Erythrobacter sp. QSSC1-22B TaxID=1860125 RepID=UPI00080567BD|nr:DUF1428 domain-containing protein [Erythrobacter sp. QSSC1-22B]OBX17704.1 RNA signal recognition particle [Erythrobacter sp. QSSC1-22B]